MRELTRCIAWTLGLGALALAIAAAANLDLAHTEGARSWIVFVAYAPFYLLVHVFNTDPADWLADTGFLAAALAGQFAYYLAVVAVIRWLWRRKRRRGR
jgi:hypothetical protein